MFDPVLYINDNDWLYFAVGVASVGDIYVLFTKFSWSDKDVTSCN